MASSSSSSKTPNNQPNTILESNKTKKSKSHFPHKNERTVLRTHHLKAPPSADQTTNRSPSSRQKRAFCSPPGSYSLQSNLFAQSSRGAREERLYARPYEEVAMGPSNPDAQNGIPIKTDGTSSSATNTKP